MLIFCSKITNANMNATRTELKNIGEFGLIDRIRQKTNHQNASTLKGIGDDAAVIETGAEQKLLLSTDMLIEKIHFDLSYVPLKHLGYKAIAVNVSDIAAMNGIPQQVTVSLGLSNRFSLEAVEELYAGIRAACEQYKVDLVGGDTVSSPTGLVISVSVIGFAKMDQIAYRNSANMGDIICVTGDLGAAYMGLQILERERQEFLGNPNMKPQLEGKDYLIRRQLKPEARMDIIHELRELGIIPTAMIDVSDGLASEIRHLATQSGLGARIYEEKIPIDRLTYEVATQDFNIQPTTCALNGGEDYELLFTISQDDFEKLKNHDDISFVGYMQEAEKGIILQTRGGNEVPIQAQGWIHFGD